MEYKFVELGGVMLHGYAEEDPFEGLIVSSVSGWRGLSGVRGEGEPIPGGQGSYQQEVLLREPRSIAVKGAAVAGSESAAAALLERLERATGGIPVPMRVSDSDGIWTRIVEVELLDPDERWSTDRFTFNIDIVANDPRRYRDVETLGPIGIRDQIGGLRFPAEFPWNFGIGGRQLRLSLTNVGSVTLYPKIIVEGGFGSVIVRDITTGGSLELPFDIPPGDEVEFDSKSSRAFYRGRDITRLMTRRQWPKIPAGATHEFDFRVTGDSGRPRMRIEYQIGGY